MLSSLLSQFKGKSLKSTLMRGGLGVLALRLFSIGLALLSSVVLARALGVEQYGIYSYVLATVTLLVVPAQFGLTTLIIRETAQSEVYKNWSNMLGVWRWSTKNALSLSLLFAVIGITVIYVIDDYRKIVFITGFFLIPIIALNSLRSAALQGLRKVVLSQLPENFIKPVLFIVLMLAVWLGFGGADANTAMIFQLLSTAVAFIIGAAMLNKLRPEQTKRKITPTYEKKKWRKAVLPMAFADGVSVVNTQADIIMLGMLTTSVQVGYYSIAATGAILIMVSVNVLVLIAMPYVVRLHEQNNRKSLCAVITNVSRIGFIISLPICFVYLLVGELSISFFYGEEYLEAYLPLVILSLAYLFKSSFGLEARVLNMLGFERDNLIGAVFVTALNIFLNYLFIKKYGAVGAAVATSISIVFQCILYWVLIKLRLGIDCSVFGSHSYFNNEKINV